MKLNKSFFTLILWIFIFSSCKQDIIKLNNNNFGQDFFYYRGSERTSDSIYKLKFVKSVELIDAKLVIIDKFGNKSEESMNGFTTSDTIFYHNLNYFQLYRNLSEIKLSLVEAIDITGRKYVDTLEIKGTYLLNVLQPEMYFSFDHERLTDEIGNAWSLNIVNPQSDNSYIDRSGNKFGALKISNGTYLRKTINQAEVNVSKNFSLCFWVRPEGNSINNFENYLLHPTHGDDLMGPNYLGIGFLIGQTSMSITTHTANHHEIQLNLTGNFNKWNFICIKVENNAVTIFEDGFKLASKQISSNVVFSLANCKHYAEAGIGRAFNNPSHDFSGGLDDFSIFNRALSDTEIKNLYFTTK